MARLGLRRREGEAVAGRLKRTTPPVSLGGVSRRPEDPLGVGALTRRCLSGEGSSALAPLGRG
jgi:hypothetical protein